jgi:PPE-repeat protein
MARHDSITPLDAGLATDFGVPPSETATVRQPSDCGAETAPNAAEAWDVLVFELQGLAMVYRAAISRLASGPQSVVAEKVAPYLGWLDATTAQASGMDVQPKAAAAAYGLTLATVVAPQLIEAIRLQGISLARASWIGQHAAAVADLDGDYERMWARGAGVVYAYARASAAAATATPSPSSPPVAEVKSADYQSTSEALGGPPPDCLNPFSRAAARHAADPSQARAACTEARFGSGLSIGGMSVPRSWTPAMPAPTWHTDPIELSHTP